MNLDDAIRWMRHVGQPNHGTDTEKAFELVVAHLDRQTAAIDRVRDLHFATEPGEWICEACSEAWPCATIRALTGEAS